METLFTQELNINGATTSFNISFHNNAYYFEPENANTTSFSIRREKDEWRTDDKLDAADFSAATAALDKYLLSQH